MYTHTHTLKSKKEINLCLREGIFTRIQVTGLGYDYCVCNNQLNSSRPLITTVFGGKDECLAEFEQRVWESCRVETQTMGYTVKHVGTLQI